MREYRITTIVGLPLVSVVISGPKATKRLQLIFDSAAFMTQIHLGILASMGFSFSGRTPDLLMKGVTGPPQPGFSQVLPRLYVLDTRFACTGIGAFDFSDWTTKGVDGLLGWDLIEKLHFEMNGPEKIMKVF